MPLPYRRPTPQNTNRYMRTKAWNAMHPDHGVVARCLCHLRSNAINDSVEFATTLAVERGHYSEGRKGGVTCRWQA